MIGPLTTLLGMAMIAVPCIVKLYMLYDKLNVTVGLGVTLFLAGLIIMECESTPQNPGEHRDPDAA